METTYHITFIENNSYATINGYDMGYGNNPAKVLHTDIIDGEVIVAVIKFKGYSYNPGSRHSMLKDYVLAATTVYEFSHIDKFNRRRFREVTSFNSSGKKE